MADARTIMTTLAVQRRGFTLIELMIVVAIIAILAAILIPNFLHARAESLTSACEANEKQIATAEEEYSVDNGGAYASLSVLTTPYMSTTMTDPVQKGNAYTVTIPGTGSNGSYQITDAGGHDTSTTTSLTQTGGAACSACASIVYAQTSGIHGN